MAGLKLNQIFPKLIQNMRSIEREVIKRGGEKAAKLLKKDIIESIERGASPVEGEKRFEKYSDSYAKAIKKGRVKGKRLRPVNLKVNGELLKSIKHKITSSGITIFFKKKVKSGLNLAEIHSSMGAGKSKTIRKILPDKNEDYKKSVMKNAKKELIRATNDALVALLRKF